MPDGVEPVQQAAWVKVLRRAAAGYLDGTSDPKQDRSRRRKQELLLAATRVFARDGIANAKMADIAAEAGVPVSSIYDYYAGKQELAYEIPIHWLAQFYAEFLVAAPLQANMRARLHLFLTMTFAYSQRDPDWARLLYLEIWPSVLIEEARVRQALDDFGRIIVEMIREGGRVGEWDAAIDPYRMATILMGSVTHMIITWLLYRRPRKLAEEASAMIEQLLVLLHHGKASKRPPRSTINVRSSNRDASRPSKKPRVRGRRAAGKLT
jgi:AcrR family transcriptional regulator